MVRLSFKKSCMVTLSPDKLRRLLLSSQPIQLKTLSACVLVAGTQRYFAENKDAWRCGYAPTCDKINIFRAAWIINGYCIGGLVNWAQHSNSKTLVKKVKSNF